MTRPKAISRVKKLLALARDRAATEPEKKLAKQRAGELIERFDLSQAEIAPDPPRRRVVRQPQPAPVWGFTANTTTTSTTGVYANTSWG